VAVSGPDQASNSHVKDLKGSMKRSVIDEPL
jgi:hypothetical protein